MIVKKHNLSIEEQKELLDPFPVDANLEPTLSGSLPYEKLDGLQFERLCYEILCSEGKNPRYNGKSGQPDYGVDIINEDNDTRCVYQCKNIKDRQSITETAGDINNAYSKVLNRWIGEQHLPPPTHFFYYSRQELNGIKHSSEYTILRDSALKTDKIDIQLWGREALDSKLRHLYAVVSGVFSEQVAKVFCTELSRPSDSKWERLNTTSEYPTLREFYSDWKENKLYVAPTLHEQFLAALSTSPVVLVQGNPGSGKTTTTLSLLAQLQNRPERIYYTVISNFDKITDLADSVKKRAHLPSVFILDDCHSAPELANELIQRLRGSVLNKNHPVSVKVVLLTRIIPKQEESIYSDALQDLLELEKESVIEVLLSDSTSLLRVLKKRLPHIQDITIRHAEHLFNLTGGNLKLASLTVKGIISADELTRLDGNSVKENVSRLYIRNKYTAMADLQYMKQLCALAMFDITPLTDYLGESPTVIKRGLATILYQPVRVRFSHSTLAEVLFYVISDKITGTVQEYDLNHQVTQELIQYFKYLTNSSVSQLNPFFLNLSTSQLSFPDLSTGHIISEFLSSSDFRAILIPDQSIVNLSILRLLLVKASGVTPQVMREIHDSICSRLSYLFSKEEAWSEEEIIDFQSGLLRISKSSAAHLSAIECSWVVNRVIEKIRQNFSIPELFRLLQYSTPSRAAELIDSLTAEDIDALVEKTNRSVGTLNLTLRDLEQKTVIIEGKEQNLLEALEKKVTAKHLLQLIINNGTIFELFMLLKHSTPSRAAELIDALNAQDINALVEKTNRSVGTLNLTLRDLEQKTVIIEGKEQNLLEALEKKVTAKHLLQLIINNGTIFELFMLLKHSTPSRAAELIDALNAQDINALVEKTNRSVGTLDLALHDLEQKNVMVEGKELNLLEALEKKITAKHLLLLIINNGTIFELFRFLQHSTPTRAAELIDSLTAQHIDTLVEKTNRSVGTLDLTLRDLEKKTMIIEGKKQNLLEALEKKVTAKHLLQLIINNGTIFELFNLLKHSTPSRAAELIDSLNAQDIDKLVGKTIEQQRSIESLHPTLHYLNCYYHHLLDALLTQLSPELFALLIAGAGTLNSLMNISRELPESYLKKLQEEISRFTIDEWPQLVFRGMPGNLIKFLSGDVQHYPVSIRSQLRTIVETDGYRYLKGRTWFELNAANYESEEATIAALREKLELVLDEISIEKLHGLDFKEATSAFSILWRHAISRHDVLNAQIWNILPSAHKWPKDYTFGFLNQVIEHLCHNDFDPHNADTLLCQARDHALKVNWNKAAPELLFHFLWKIWQAGYHLSTDSSTKYLPKSLSDKTTGLLKTALSKKVSGKSDKIALYGLAGLLWFICPAKKSDLVVIMKGRLRGLDIYRNEIYTSLENNSISVVSAYFSLYGMGLVCPPKVNFTEPLKSALTAKALAMPYTTKAVEKLLADLKKYD